MGILRVFVTALVTLALGCNTAPRSVQRTSVPDPVIDTFYPTTMAISRGEAGVLCYGVQSASDVRIEPPVEKLHPALTYCFHVQTDKTTTYTLVAVNRDGKEARKQATLTVGGVKPKLQDMFVSADKVKPGEEIALCWKSTGATQVEAGPGEFDHGGRASRDCIRDRPTKTTRYSVTVSNSLGMQDTDSIVVTVKQSR